MPKQQYISPHVISMLFLPIGLTVLIYYILWGSIYNILIYSFLPVFLFLFLISFKKPTLSIFILFTFNYFLIPWLRYSQIEGFSVWSDILWWLALVIVIIYSFVKRDILWKRALNPLTIGGFIWAVYTTAEIANPSAITDAWVFSRSLIYSTFLVSLLVSVLISSFKHVRILLRLLSVFTFFAVMKALIQRYIGFDWAEQIWLSDVGNSSTHLLPHMTRYFSFFSDAGNFGSNMGFATTVLTITAIYMKDTKYKVYYLIMAALALYAMFMSGTRGAMFVPLGGLLLFSVMSKNVKLMIVAALLGIGIYIFFAHTNIAQGNHMVSRMRTSFKPSKDASYLVRKQNQQKLAAYLKNKPFGEGLGLGGVEARKYASRVTTIIPNDSTYVKIWMETGIVGLILYLTIYMGSLIRGCYIIMFQVKDLQLRGVLTALACGIFGMMISAYGNAFFNQFPTGIMMILFLSILLNGHYIDEELTKSKNQAIPKEI